MEKQITNLNVQIRKAVKEDFDSMLTIINNVRIESSVLKKNKKQLMGSNYFVAVVDNCIVGTIGFKVWPDKLPEIISLVVIPEQRGRKIGTMLVRYCLTEIKKEKLTKVFALTTTPRLLEKLNFQKVDIKIFPEKIKCDCRKCLRNAGDPDNPLCNEIPMYLNL